jgi:hypothetical protein
MAEPPPSGRPGRSASYLLSIACTTDQIVYDLLPVVLPGERRYQTLLKCLSDLPDTPWEASCSTAS